MKVQRDLIFPGCEQAARDELPASGLALRRTHKTIAFDCGIDSEMAAFLTGIPKEMSTKYALRQMLLKGRMLRQHQRAISRRVLELLGTDPTL